MNFLNFKKAIQVQLKKMCADGLFATDTDGYALYDLYQASFPAGTNPIFRNRAEHDCNCCKSFIKQLGGVVSIKNGVVSTIWDIQGEDVDPSYQVVAAALSKFVKEKKILHPFHSGWAKVGTDWNYDKESDQKWNHFFYELPKVYVLPEKDIPSYRGKLVSNKEVLQRSISEIQDSAVDIIMELIDQGSIYRGAEHKKTVELLKKLKQEYNALPGDIHKEKYLWDKSTQLGESSKIRNTVIGTLLMDVSDGVELEAAVKKFEAKVAPQNYKRPSALITQGMVKKAQETVQELGLENALSRRFAVVTDIKANNILFADRSIRGSLQDSPFSELIEGATVQKPNLDKIQEVPVAEFLDKILPKAEKVEIYLENSFENNLMTLIAPEDQEANGLFTWDNGFSWSYKGEFADSIKERVKAAGGKVDGYFRASLSWENYDDLDLHCYGPQNEHIYFSIRHGQSGGHLDVDENAGLGRTRTPVENIIWSTDSKLREGDYRFAVNNFAKRESTNVGYTLETECNGQVWTFEVPVNESKDICTFNYTKKNGFVLKSSIQSKQSTREIWGLNTNAFQAVQLIMKSPNHWDDKAVGNEHLFFIMDKCKNPDDARGFYNEFLNPKLNEHRKVFEVLGSKMKAKNSAEQLSGVGFSSTQKGHVILKISGSFNRTIKVLF